MASGTSNVIFYVPGIRIKGLNFELMSGSPLSSAPMIDFSYLDGISLEDVIIHDETTIDNNQILLRAYQCNNVDLEKTRIVTLNSAIALHLYKCDTVSGRSVQVVNTGDQAVQIEECNNVIGFDGLNAIGPGTAGKDIKAINNVGFMRLGRIATTDSLLGAGFTESGNSLGFDEFVKLRILKDLIVDGYSIINGGSYEILIAMIIGWIQSLHSLPWMTIPGGWVDGFVDDSVINWNL